MFRMEGSALTVDDSNRLIVAGTSYTQFGFDYVTVTRMTATGQIDTSFGTAGYSTSRVPLVNGFIRITSVAVDHQNRIVIGGYETSSSSFGVVRLTADGAFDTTFDGDGFAFPKPSGVNVEQAVGMVAIQSDDKILIAGNDNPVRNVLVGRLSENGSVDASYSTGGWYRAKPENQGGSIRKVLIGPDDDATLGLYCSGGCGLGIARLTDEGLLDLTFGSDDDGSTYMPVSGPGREFDLVQTSDGLYVASGQADQQGNSGDEIAIGRFDIDGTTDSSFGTDGSTVTDPGLGQIKTVSIVQVPSGDVVVSGTLIPRTGTKKFVLAAYLTQ